ncbi:MAG: flavodoxin [Planctomycetota bacterium]|jgi:flavodoxin short chain|nr:flavodoxin [Planctomycetota bacterium]
MARIIVVYWSGTGNTARMAELIAEGAAAAGAEVTCKSVSDASVAEALGFDRIALGSPAMGAEVIEEQEMEPFVEELSKSIQDRKIGLFGSYDWGDGEWLRSWAERLRGHGAQLADEGLAVHLAPEGDDQERCRAWGRQLPAF